MVDFLAEKVATYKSITPHTNTNLEFCQVILLAALDLDKYIPQVYRTLIPSLYQIMSREITFTQTKLMEVGRSLIAMGYSEDEIIDGILNLIGNSLRNKFPNGDLFQVLENTKTS